MITTTMLQEDGKGLAARVGNGTCWQHIVCWNLSLNSKQLETVAVFTNKEENPETANGWDVSQLLQVSLMKILQQEEKGLWYNTVEKKHHRKLNPVLFGFLCGTHDRKRGMERERHWSWRLFWDRKEIPWSGGSKGQSIDFTNHLILLTQLCACVRHVWIFSGMRCGLQVFIISRRALWPCQDYRVQFKSLCQIIGRKLFSVLVEILKCSEIAEKSSCLSAHILRTQSGRPGHEWYACVAHAVPLLDSTLRVCVHTHTHTISLSPSEQFLSSLLGSKELTRELFWGAKGFLLKLFQWPHMALQSIEFPLNKWSLGESSSTALEPSLRYTRQKEIPCDCWTKTANCPEDHMPLNQTGTFHHVKEEG